MNDKGKNTLRPLLTIAALTACAVANAMTWNCTNQDMEIGCSESACTALPSGDFTPMNISFTDEGFVFACMYSGCWEGGGEVFRGERFLSIHARNLTYSTDPDPGEMRQDIAVLVDLDDNIAMMKAGGYAQPLVCTTSAE